jgi:hypothetical protein
MGRTLARLKQNRRKGNKKKKKKREERNKTEEKIQREASVVSPAPCVGECKEVRSKDWTLQLK